MSIPVPDPMAEIRYWGIATMVAVFLWVITIVGFNYAKIPAGNTATVLAIELAIVVFCSENFRTKSEAKARADAEIRRREQENYENGLKLERVAKKADEVKEALVHSDARHDSQVGQLQGTVNTVHGTVQEIKNFVDGEHGVVLRALAASLAREAAQPGATEQQKAAADQASQSSRTHDERQAAFEAQTKAASAPLTSAVGPIEVVVVNPVGSPAMVKLADHGLIDEKSKETGPG